MTKPKIRLLHGDCRELLRDLPDDSVDACVTDPPYHLTSKRGGKRGFMGKSWDGGRVAYDVDLWREVLRVLKPGAHLLAFGGDRTHHRLACAIEDAGFEIRTTITWHYGCLTDDAEVLTDRGWVRYDRATPGSRALCFDLGTGGFKWGPIEDCFLYQYSDTAFRIRSDRTDHVVTRGHRVVVERSGTYVLRYIEEVARQCQIRIPILEGVSSVFEGVPDARQSSSSKKENVFEKVCEQGGQPEEHRPTGAARTINEGADHLPGMRTQEVEAPGLGETGKGTRVFPELQRCPTRSGMEETRAQGAGRVDGRVFKVVPRENERPEQPGMEGRGDVLRQSRELSGRAEIRSVPGRLPADGAQGRIRGGTPAGRGPGDRPSTEAIRSRAPRGPRPAQQRPGQPAAIREQPRSQAARTPWIPIPDLARIEPVRYEGIVWCVKVPTGAFVARQNGQVFVTGNSGFPKSLAIDKAIDKRPGIGGKVVQIKKWLAARIQESGKTRRAIDEECGFTACSFAKWKQTGRPDPWVFVLPNWRKWKIMQRVVGFDSTWDTAIEEADREVTGQGKSGKTAGMQNLGPSGIKGGEYDLTTPATDEAKKWEGWGTALKPATEFVTLARAPLSGTVAANVLAHGTGGINVDGCRVGTGGEQRKKIRNDRGRGTGSTYCGGPTGELCGSRADGVTTRGRWPANVITSHHPECHQVGTRRVKTGRLGDASTEGIHGFGTGRHVDYCDDDGREQVEAWECALQCHNCGNVYPAPGLHPCLECGCAITSWLCPVRMLDEQSGPAGAASPVKGTEPSATTADVYGKFAKRATNNRIDKGGASRFFANLNWTDGDRCCFLCDLPSGSRSGTVGTCKKTANSAGENTKRRKAGSGSAGTDVPRKRPPESVDRSAGSGTPARNAGSGSGTSPGTSGDIVRRLANPDRIERIAHNAKCAADLCDLCATAFARSLAAMQLGHDPASLPGLDCMRGSKGRVLIQNLAHIVGLLGKSDTTPTIESLTMLFGCVERAISTNITWGSSAEPDNAPIRFKYCPKSSRREREAGCADLPPVTGAQAVKRKEGTDGLKSPRAGAGRTASHVRNRHPTIKPIKLMRWLVRLVTPPGGTVLDPFAGSGTTGIACVEERKGAVLIELDKDYCRIAEARIRHTIAEARKGK